MGFHQSRRNQGAIQIQGLTVSGQVRLNDGNHATLNAQVHGLAITEVAVA
ncbi:MAG: hypothetical protein VCD33_02420 [Alphaproteobacteria bacterium]